MTNRLTLGAAQFTIRANGTVFIQYMTEGSFTVGERVAADEATARAFCRARDLRVL